VTKTVLVNRNNLVYFPNAFSPNGDELNDIYTMSIGDGVREILDFRIYDRWGSEVFSAQNCVIEGPGSCEWDGTFRGQALTRQLLVYFAEVELVDGTKKIFSGGIQIIR